MPLDPRSKLSARCPASKQVQQGTASASKNFFSAAKKVGDLEILNEVGFGKVAEGLRNLASVSDTIRTSGSIPSVLQNTANDENNVLSAVGIDTNVATQVANFHPEVANRALGQAKSIAQKVRQGGFELNDIPGAFADLQNLKTLGEGIFPGESGTGVRTRNSLIEKCDPSPYAQDLISYYPKYKFLFVVEFKYTEAFKNLDFINHAFVVKNTTRPNIEFDYDEINMYNFWTRVVKRMTFQPMTMRFYDDSWNQAMQFYNSYLQSMSPITNLDFQQGSEVTRELEESGMRFDIPGTGSTPKQGGASGAATTHRYAASIGPLADSATTKTILSRINLYHVYREGARMNVYQFINPKITNLELDELDMADNGGGNEVSLQFAYDTVNILTNVDTIKDSRFRIEEVSSGSAPGAQVLYPLAPIPGLDPDETRKSFNTAVSEDEFGPGNSAQAAADATTADPLEPFGGAGPDEVTRDASAVSNDASLEQEGETLIAQGAAANVSAQRYDQAADFAEAGGKPAAEVEALRDKASEMRQVTFDKTFAGVQKLDQAALEADHKQSTETFRKGGNLSNPPLTPTQARAQSKARAQEVFTASANAANARSARQVPSSTPRPSGASN